MRKLRERHMQRGWMERSFNHPSAHPLAPGTEVTIDYGYGAWVECEMYADEKRAGLATMMEQEHYTTLKAQVEWSSEYWTKVRYLEKPPDKSRLRVMMVRTHGLS